MLPPDLLMIFYVTSSSVDEPPLSPTSGFTVGNPRLQNLFSKCKSNVFWKNQCIMQFRWSYILIWASKQKKAWYLKNIKTKIKLICFCVCKFFFNVKQKYYKISLKLVKVVGRTEIHYANKSKIPNILHGRLVFYSSWSVTRKVAVSSLVINNSHSQPPHQLCRQSFCPEDASS